MRISSNRAIITAFYVFLLEAEERSMELQLKSTKGSSLGPIISHLFSGGLIFESLLKSIYSSKDNTLNDFFKNNAEFKKDFGVKVKTSSKNLQNILNSISDNSPKTAFSTTTMLRNTTGHNLVWTNIFKTDLTYEILVNQIMNALLYLIEKKFIHSSG